MPRSTRSVSKAIETGGTFLFDEVSVEQVVAMILTLSGEVWAQRERLTALELALVSRGALQPKDAENYEFTEDQEAMLAELRKEFLTGLFSLLERRAVKPRRKAKAPTRRARASTRPRGARRR